MSAEHPPQSRCHACRAALEQEGLRFCPKCGARLESGATAGSGPASPTDPMLGRIIADNFRLDEVLGTGSMGTIYKAEQLSLGKTVVIKVLHRHLLGDRMPMERFRREARSASRLNHPNVIHVIDFGKTEDGPLYIAMEYVAGKDLATVLDQEFPLEAKRILRILEQVCYALDEAQAHGVLHRDLKPENIVVGSRRNTQDFVKVLDFGIAKLVDDAQEKNAVQTVAGVVCGTPEYMSPEQARGEDLDHRSDLYALGVLLYQLLTHRLPFDGETPLAIVTQHLSSEPVPPRRIAPEIPRAMEVLTLSLLAKDRERRPRTALDVANELRRIDRELIADELLQSGHDEGAPTAVELKPVERPDPAEEQSDQRLRALQDLPVASHHASGSSAPAEPNPASGPQPTQVMNAAGGAAGTPAEPRPTTDRDRTDRGEGRPPDESLDAVAQRARERRQRTLRRWLLAVLVALALAAAGWGLAVVLSRMAESSGAASSAGDARGAPARTAALSPDRPGGAAGPRRESPRRTGAPRA